MSVAEGDALYDAALARVTAAKAVLADAYQAYTNPFGVVKSA
jgi:hypothetical protein